MEVTGGFAQLLGVFRGVFTAPTFPRFVRIMTGWVMSPRRRFVTDTIVSSDSTREGHFSLYHRFFSRASWSLDVLWRLLAVLVVDTLIGPEASIMLCADDTLCRKRGLTLFGAGMHHDPLISSRAMKLVSWGHDWVVVCVLVVNPFWAPGKTFALPICARLYKNRQGLTKGQKKDKRSSRTASGKAKGGRNRKTSKARAQARKRAKAAASKAPPKPAEHRTRPELLVEMLRLISGWFPTRQFCVTADSLYSGKSVLRQLPSNFHQIGQVHPKGALYKPAAPREPGQRGRQRLRGERLPDRDQWAADDTPWQKLEFKQFGLHATLEVKVQTGLYYKAGRDRLLTFVLSRDAKGDRPLQIFYCTDLELGAREILSRYANRWAIEVTFEHSKQLLGLEDPANRTQLAVQRTAPMALVLYTLVVVWFHREGHQHAKFPHRPWYRQKRVPSFPDMLTTLRRRSWEELLETAAETGTCDNYIHKLQTYLGTLAG